MKALLVIATLVAVSQAHLCLFNPIQRGNISGLDKAGSPDCGLDMQPPCGGRDKPDKREKITFMAGMNETIIFQKNLDHWYMENPGTFLINFWSGMPLKMQTLLTIPDTDTPSLTVYARSVTMPDMEAEEAILQLVYMTNNPNAPAEFYQCADIRNMKP